MIMSQTVENKMSNLEAAQKIAELLHAIANQFNVEVKDVKIDTCCPGVGMIFRVTQHTTSLMAFDSVQFEQFCEKMDLEGIIFFQRQGLVEFAMNPKPLTVPKFIPDQVGVMEITIINEYNKSPYKAKVPQLTQEMFELMARGHMDGAIELYQNSFGETRAVAVAACQQYYETCRRSLDNSYCYPGAPTLAAKLLD